MAKEASALGGRVWIFGEEADEGRGVLLVDRGVELRALNVDEAELLPVRGVRI